jgi:HEAT repeat protein
VQPLLASPDSHLRLAAVWAIGEFSRRGKPAKMKAERLSAAVRPLLDDPVLQIRLTAAETLHALGSAPAPSLLPGH